MVTGNRNNIRYQPDAQVHRILTLTTPSVRHFQLQPMLRSCRRMEGNRAARITSCRKFLHLVGQELEQLHVYPMA